MRDATSVVCEIIISIIGWKCQSNLWCEKSSMLHKTQSEENLQRHSNIAHMNKLKYALPLWSWHHSSMTRTANWSICFPLWTRRGFSKLKVPIPAHFRLPDIYVKITENTFWGWTDLISSQNDIREAICHGLMVVALAKWTETCETDVNLKQTGWEGRQIKCTVCEGEGKSSTLPWCL